MVPYRDARRRRHHATRGRSADRQRECCVPAFNYHDGQRLGMWICTNGENRRWEFTGGTLRTRNNMCMDIRNWNVADGAELHLWECNGGTNQKWRRG
ncbi:RICIN domain-containing protein [Actinoplanes auranticolor]|uniref:RICIN domain-containing protein n=1 Tax=Actinoplanes auranticolor TaxID=47988 RepID=UPI00248499BA|nr:ricin-type beta-trefoil lectin domain protein [Actinoplanes auranticolor]